MFFVFFLPALILIFSGLAKRLAGKHVLEMTYLVSSETSNLNWVNHSVHSYLMKH